MGWTPLHYFSGGWGGGSNPLNPPPPPPPPPPLGSTSGIGTIRPYKCECHIKEKRGKILDLKWDNIASFAGVTIGSFSLWSSLRIDQSMSITCLPSTRFCLSYFLQFWCKSVTIIYFMKCTCFKIRNKNRLGLCNSLKCLNICWPQRNLFSIVLLIKSQISAHCFFLYVQNQ